MPNQGFECAQNCVKVTGKQSHEESQETLMAMLVAFLRVSFW